MIPQIDDVSLKVRLPIESSRAVRTLNERLHYKANEWRNIAFYLAIENFMSRFNLKYRFK